MEAKRQDIGMDIDENKKEEKFSVLMIFEEINHVIILSNVL